MDRSRLCELLLHVTDDPERSSSWVDRIAMVAGSAGLQRAQINWNASPLGAAFNVIEEAYRCGAGKVAALADAVNAKAVERASAR